MHIYSSGVWSFTDKKLESGHILDSMSEIHAAHYDYKDLLEMLQDK